MTIAQLERRVAALEKAMSAMQDQAARGVGAQRWWIENAGRFKNDAVFDEIARLGREYRASLRPRRRKVKRDHS